LQKKMRDRRSARRHEVTEDVASGAVVSRLFEEHRGLVLGAALRVTGNLADAEDVLQTVFARLAVRLPRVEPQDQWPAYLHRAAINAALDVLRSRKRAGAIGLEDLANEPVDATAGPERRSVDAERRLRLRQALGRERKRSATIFALRYFEGYSNSEIAHLLGSTRVSVGVTLHRIRNRLKRQMAEEA